MLIEFKTKNFKSFYEEMCFSMKPAPKQTGLDYSILTEKIGKKVYKGLCSSVIYGPNASGKTNIISAMEAFKSIVLRGNINNSEKLNTPNAAAFNLELIPNNLVESAPVEFYIKFIDSKLLFEYNLSIDLGPFMDNDYARKILLEELHINEKLIFHRGEQLEIGDLNVIEDYLVNEFSENYNSIINVAKSNLIEKELFLMNGFKNMFSSKIVKIISQWFEKKFKVVYRADALEIINLLDDPNEETIYINKTVNEAAKIFGITSNGIGYIYPDGNTKPKLVSVIKKDKNKEVVMVLAELFESYGTVRFVKLFPLIIEALMNGCTLVIDEFDASIHPMALMSIINIFHNNDINKKNAQLIFDTHNPIFLNSNLFRRDEIKFVERSDESHFSILYSLSDFGTSNEKGVRKHEDYLKNYFINKYGAIKDIDFTSIFESLVDIRNGVNNNEKEKNQ